jgi:hypothetical protein
MEEIDKIISLLRSKGPLKSEDIGSTLGIDAECLSRYLEELTQTRVINNGEKGYWVPYTSTINNISRNSTEKNARKPELLEKISDLEINYNNNIGLSRTFCDYGATRFGMWKSEVSYTPAKWRPRQPLRICVDFTIPDEYWTSMSSENIHPTHALLLVTAERTFDAEGVFRMPSDNGMSTLLTPTGLPIEGGVQGAVSPRAGYTFGTPVNEFAQVPESAMSRLNGSRTWTFTVETTLPDDLPPGLYRLRLDYGFRIGTRLLDLNMMAFARSGLLAEQCDTESYSPLIPASARHVSGRMVDADGIVPRLPWVLLKQYNSNGYRGVIANEDRGHFALSSRNLIQDDVILPRFSETDPDKPIRYSLEPQFPTDRFEKKRGIPCEHKTGELSVQITAPDGTITDLGMAAFDKQNGRWLTTGNPEPGFPR